MNNTHIKRKLPSIATLQKDALCKNYPDKPGFNNSVIELYLDCDIYFPKDIIMLEDENSYLYLYSNLPPKRDSHDHYIYVAKSISSNPNSFINPELLKKGCKIIRQPDNEGDFLYVLL